MKGESLCKHSQNLYLIRSWLTQRMESVYTMLLSQLNSSGSAMRYYELQKVVVAGRTAKRRRDLEGS